MSTLGRAIAGVLLASLGCAPASATQEPASSNPQDASGTVQTPSQRFESGDGPRAGETSGRPFEMVAPPGWTKTPAQIGFRMTSADGELRVDASGPFPRSELQRQQEFIDQSLPELVWTTQPLGGGDLIAATVEVEGRGTRIGFFATPTAHVLVTLDAPRTIGPHEVELHQTIAAGIEIRRIIAPREVSASGCPDEVVQSARAQGLCLDPAQFGKERVQACMDVLAAEGIKRAPFAAAGIGKDSGVRVVCWEAP